MRTPEEVEAILKQHICAGTIVEKDGEDVCDRCGAFAKHGYIMFPTGVLHEDNRKAKERGAARSPEIKPWNASEYVDPLFNGGWCKICGEHKELVDWDHSPCREFYEMHNDDEVQYVEYWQKRIGGISRRLLRESMESKG